MTIDDFLTALEASPTTRQRDRIIGKTGWIYARDEGFYFYCDPGSVRSWNSAKKALSFAKVTQDGDFDGFLFLDRLPTPAEAEVIRERLGLRKKRVLSDAERERLARTAFRPKRADHAS